jgi:uncharacterized protein (TIGR02145 family)
MKAKILFGLLLLATLGVASCKKDKDEPQPEPTTVKIGNKDYSIVKIGTQSWIGENYSGEGGVTFSNGTKPEYGKFYTLAEAKAIALPAGWRLPTKEDFQTLLEVQGATLTTEGSFTFTNNVDVIKKIMSTTGWKDFQGTNTSNFNILPAGLANNTTFTQSTTTAYFWTSSTHSPGNYPYYFYLGQAAQTKAGYVNVQSSLENYRFNIRFVKGTN